MQLLRMTLMTVGSVHTLACRDPLDDWDEVGTYDHLDLALDDGQNDTGVSQS